MPRLLLPTADARVPYTLTFEWSAVPGAPAYAIEVAETEDFADPLLVDDTAAATVYEVDLPVIGPLWWRVRALDPRGTPGPWSAVRRLNIQPPPLAASVFGITLTPATVSGGEPSEGLVTLTDPAPDTGATVLLSAAGGGKVKLPPRILIPAGETSATFAIATAHVSADTPVRIVASARREPKAATLTIAPPRPPARLSSFSVTPAILAGGERAQGIVTLARPAPSATVIRLASSDASRVALPASVAVAAGASAASFYVVTAHATTSATVTLTAALDDIVRTATLNLRAAAGIESLPPPAQIAPGEAAALRYGPVEFAWSDVSGAASYTIEVAGSLTSPILASRTVPASRLSLVDLPPGVFWWRVRGNDANGAPGQWSPPRLLRLVAR